MPVCSPNIRKQRCVQYDCILYHLGLINTDISIIESVDSINRGDNSYVTMFQLSQIAARVFILMLFIFYIYIVHFIGTKLCKVFSLHCSNKMYLVCIAVIKCI